jgi:anti-anti-sigma factor
MTSRSRMNGSWFAPIAGGSQAGLLDIHVQEHLGITIIWAAGEVDLHTVPTLRNALNSASEGAQHVVVDLGSVKYIDST